MEPPRLFATLGAVLADWRAVDPEATALITEDRTLSVATLAGLVDAQIRGLEARTEPGARIGVSAANSPETLALLYAAPASGRVLVPLNTRLSAPEMADQLDRAGVTLLVGDPVEGFGGPRIDLGDLHQALPASTAAADPADTDAVGSVGDGDSLAWIIFTSGSTGRPKGVRLTHASLASAVSTTAAARPIFDDDVYLYPFPLFHVAVYNVIHAHVRRRPVVLPDRFDARRIIELSHAHRVTAMSVAATMLRMLLDALDADPDLAPPSSLRTIAYGAAPMPEPLLREADRVFACDFAQGYGSTELSGNAVFLGPDAHRQGLAGHTRYLHAAGYAGPGVALRIVDDTGQDVPVGAPGELLVAGGQVCGGYLDDPEATAATIRDGWLHTGDIATLDADGLLSIVDRAKDVVVTGGENVASRQVEDVLRTHPLVADVAVVGRPDAHWGEAVTAVIVPSPTGWSEAAQVGDGPAIRPAPTVVADDLRRHVAERLAGYAKPRGVFLTTTLPHNANGKIDKPALRARLADLDAES